MNQLSSEFSSMPNQQEGPIETVLDLIVRQAKLTPDVIAIVYNDQSLSYRTLLSRVDHWAARLLELGLARESVVGIYLMRSPDLITAILAVMRAGASYLPLDRVHPSRRCEEILKASGAAAVISDHAFEGMAHSISPTALDQSPHSQEPLPRLASLQLAYVIYTSGSTGAPKGVAIEHASLLNHMLWMVESFGPAASTRVLQRTSCAFDASVWELFLSPMTGGTMVLQEGASQGDPNALRELLIREMPTAMQCVPTFLRLACDAGSFVGTCLQFLFVGGEALTSDLVLAVRRQTGSTVVNLYGPTETTIDATYFVIGDSAHLSKTCPIGRTISNVTAKTVNADYSQAPESSDAELWIGGMAVGRGYHREPSSTARCFVPDPFSGVPGARAYRSGDRTTHENGVFTFLSRADRLLKLHGFRVEPSEIEAMLRQHPAVHDAIVLARDEGGATTLVAYCIASQGTRTDTGEVRTYLHERLPHYMAPARFVWLERFPVKSNGKLDTEALPAPVMEANLDFPANETEAVLVSIVGRLFKRTVGVSDNFFDLGGDSIRSIQLITLAKEQGLQLRLQDVFECPTIRGLATRVTQSTDQASLPIPFELVPKQDQPQLDRNFLCDAYPTSMLLDALYFLNETSPRYEVYVTSCELEAPWDPEALTTALTGVVARHPWLRTSFAFDGVSRSLQLVHKQVPIGWDFHDVSHLPSTEQHPFLLSWIDTEKQRKFDWSEVPVWRISIHKWDSSRIQLTLSEPVFDGWSVSSFLGELITRYAAALKGEPVLFPSSQRATYRDFIVSEQQTLQSPESIEFWKREMAADLGRAIPRWTHLVAENRGGQRIEMRLSASQSARLREVAKLTSAPLKSVLLAAHARVLAALTGRARVASGVVMNGRAESAGAEQVLGLHINTAPLAFDLGAGCNWLELIQQVFEVEKKALPHRRYPLAAIQKMHGRTPLFEAAFNFTHFHGLQEALRPLSVKVLRYLALDQTFFPLTAQFHVDVNDSSIGLGLDYDSAEFPKAQIEEIANLYGAALDQMSWQPKQSFKGPLRETLTSPREAVGSFSSSSASVLKAFGRIVLEMPDQIAVVTAEEQISYRKLAWLASALAARIGEMGVTGKSVLVCFPNQQKALISLLAILEVGAVYVPVDPGSPVDRIDQIARNASVSICLCDESTELQLRESGLTTLKVDLWELAGTGFASANSVPVSARPGCAYRIYTSGSTGQPKGVEVGHEALEHFLAAITTYTQMTSSDIVLGITTISFDISLLEMLLPITVGARLVTIDRDVCRDGSRLAQSLMAFETTFCQATPTTWRMLLETNDAMPAGLTAISGGEALTLDLATRILANGVNLTNAYGPTETTIWSAACPVRPGKAIRLAGPLGTTSVKVVGPLLDECLLGVEGEILIGGRGLAQGYVGNPRLTAERFIPDTAGGGRRCYRTGDIGRFTADGSIEFLGRADDQIKFRGYRVELGEIEAALCRCDDIRSAAVSSHSNSSWLTAYVVLKNGTSLDEDQVKRNLRRRLPDYMVPKHYVVLESLPLTANQKVDRSRLPTLHSANRSGRRAAELFEQVRRMNEEEVRRSLGSR